VGNVKPRLNPWHIVEENGQFFIRHKRFVRCRGNRGPYETLAEVEAAMGDRRERDHLYGKLRYHDIAERGRENNLLREMGCFNDDTDADEDP